MWRGLEFRKPGTEGFNTPKLEVTLTRSSGEL